MGTSSLSGIRYFHPSPKSLERYPNQKQDSDATDWNVRKPKYALVFRDVITGEKRFVTDVQRTKYRRERRLRSLLETYWDDYRENKVMLVSAVVDAAEYRSARLMVCGLRKRLKSRNAVLLGYFWCRDKGDQCQRNHFHLIFAARGLNREAIKGFYTSNHSNAQPLKTRYGMRFYLTIKELISPNRKNSYSSSRISKTKGPLRKIANNE
jgi:hypothetical protein